MRATIDRAAFTRAYQTVSACCPRSSPKPILQSVKLQVAYFEPEDMLAATLEATDMDVGIMSDVSGCKVELAGSVLLPAAFGEVLRASNDDQLTLETRDGTLVIDGDHSHFELATEDVSLFPAVPAFASEDCYECCSSHLASAIDQTAFCCDPQSTRFALGGTLWEIPSGHGQLTIVASDGRRLAKATMESHVIGEPKPPHNPPIVSLKALKLLQRIARDTEPHTQFYFDDRSVMLRCGDVTIAAQLVEGRFPDYKQVFPVGKPERIELAVGPFRSALSQASTTTAEESRGVDFTFSAGSLALKAQSSGKGSGKVQLAIPYDGAGLGITFDPNYLLHGLKALSDDSIVTLELHGKDQAVVLRTGAEWVYVVMPLTRD